MSVLVASLDRANVLVHGMGLGEALSFSGWSSGWEWLAILS